ncbi:hydrolase TatD family protein [Shewanella sairae]|uniref:Hydrolase TatD family protein n=2 Tax=Shewanella sairae TaxID=190310 RepID=A0ABQ4P805_9GAMM|nr:hydrolase TatD family protein [Shewanella sairae]
MNKLQTMIDSHAHLDFADFDTDRGQLLQQMHRSGISNVIIPSVSEAQWDNQISIALQHNCFYALGIHPWHCEEASKTTLATLRQMLQKYAGKQGLVAVGECGLDKLHKSNFATQMILFEGQIALAKEFDLPLIIHAVRAHEDVLRCLNNQDVRRKGVIHGFYGGPQLAAQYVKLGYKLGVGGLLLNDNAPKLQQTVAELPLESFILETDSPAMTPKNSLNSRNTPLILPEVLQKMADLQKKSTVLVSEQMFYNVAQLFDL